MSKKTGSSSISFTGQENGFVTSNQAYFPSSGKCGQQNTSGKFCLGTEQSNFVTSSQAANQSCTTFGNAPVQRSNRQQSSQISFGDDSTNYTSEARQLQSTGYCRDTSSYSIKGNEVKPTLSNGNNLFHDSNPSTNSYVSSSQLAFSAGGNNYNNYNNNNSANGGFFFFFFFIFFNF
jgi:hypothetical protein